MEPRKVRVARRPLEWENVHWRRFLLNLTKVCPWSLPNTTHLAVLRWSLVSASLCATLCTHSHQKWPRSIWRLGRQNRGFDGGSKKSSTRVKNCSFLKQIGSGCSSDGVCIPSPCITVRNREKLVYKKMKNVTLSQKVMFLTRPCL